MRSRSVLLLCILPLLAGCATVSDPFSALAPPPAVELPEAALRETAASIERSVPLGDPDAATDTAVGVSAESPLVRQAVRTRTLRYPRIAELLRSGHVYELRNGLIKINTTSAYKKAYDSGAKNRNAQLVLRENEDRWALYEGLVEENGWSGKALDKVRSIFFEARLDAMPPGQYYENADGELAEKT